MTSTPRFRLLTFVITVILMLLIVIWWIVIYRGKGQPGPAGDGQAKASMWKPEYQASLDRAVKWLLDNQHKDGRWGHFLPKRPNDIYLGGVNSLKAFGSASSALCCMALLMQPGSEKVNAALRKGYRYLINSPDTARVTGTTFYNIWSHSYMLQAISRGLKDERLKDLHADLKKRGEHELKRLLSLQAPNGGYGYYDFYYKTYRPSGRMANSFCAATAAVAFKEARKAGFEVPEKRIRSALDYIFRMRFPNGAYAYSTPSERYPHGSASKIRGSLGRSQACNNGLIIWDRLKKEDIRKGFENFIEEHEFIEMGRCRQFPHEAWYATAPYYYYYGHYYASRNLDHLPGKVRKSFTEQLTDFIVLTQFDDGSFWDFPLYGYTKAYGTGFGALILSNCRKHLQ
ncbi:MAG: hypothetical protein E3J72_19325 [Planctomycetota bacterium]|nr:MAG: hypothetical protein E3J72_19325 [Planctomycetota bacterium]